MKATPDTLTRFVRRTHLEAGEYRKNFRQIDDDILSTVTSAEADLITPLMSKVYLRLINAPSRYWEKEGTLRFEGEIDNDNKSTTAWTSLCRTLGVASATARKALAWMHTVGVIGYYAGKNGVGIRIFINRALTSIGNRHSRTGNKVLSFSRTSSDASRASQNEVPFNDSFAVLETLDIKNILSAPKTGAEKIRERTESLDHASLSQETTAISTRKTSFEHSPADQPNEKYISSDAFVRRLRRELEDSLQHTARQAAKAEHERTREWLEKRGLPKAARVAQREAYNILRRFGVIKDLVADSVAANEVGRTYFTTRTEGALSTIEIEELAGACVALLETKGQPIDLTLFGMRAEEGGFLEPDDILVVRDRVKALLNDAVDTP